MGALGMIKKNTKGQIKQVSGKPCLQELQIQY